MKDYLIYITLITNILLIFTLGKLRAKNEKKKNISNNPPIKQNAALIPIVIYKDYNEALYAQEWINMEKVPVRVLLGK